MHCHSSRHSRGLYQNFVCLTVLVYCLQFKMSVLTLAQQSGCRHPQFQYPHQNQTQRRTDLDQATYLDVYSHPAAVAYAAAYPHRIIPKFGPYLLLQTLTEHELGKVKLGLHRVWGEEVTVKLIKRRNVDTNVKMSKVEREIKVLRVCRFLFIL